MNEQDIKINQSVLKQLRHLTCIFFLVSESNRTTAFWNIFNFNVGAVNMYVSSKERTK